MDINSQKRYVFKEAYVSQQGTIPVNTEITLFRNNVYCNGGICDGYSRGLFYSIINNSQLKNKYLTEIKIINNKL